MKQVCLIDVDSKIPNLALMRASTWHKRKGDNVTLGYSPLFDKPDVCYASKMFRYTKEPPMPDCETFKGGPGYDLEARMPFEDYDRIMPDYALYRCGYALGRFTRGCLNRCPWCVVPKMDGNTVRQVADLRDFWSGQQVVRLLDDNIMADEDIFCRACEQLHEARVRVMWEALDIRLVNDRTARALASVRPANCIHFAWDGHSQDGYIERGVRLLEQHGAKPWRLMFYILVGFNTDEDYDMHRVLKVHALGCNPFVMPYDRSVPYQRHMARWVNNKAVFKTITFADYAPWVAEQRRMAEALC